MAHVNYPLDRADVRGTFGEYTIDGMDADEWIRESKP